MQSVLIGRCKVKQGDKYGKRTVIGVPFYVREHWKRGGRKALCVVECECGRVSLVPCPELVRRARRCLKCGAERLVTHGGSGTKLHSKWAGMKRRCLNPNDKRYPEYGGRGIMVCDPWLAFEPFRDWAQANGFEDGLEIDRIDVNGNYEPANCRWIAHAEQARNKRTNVWVTAFGETKLLAEWGRDERCKVTWTCVQKRLKKGWPAEMAIAKAGQ